MKVRARAPVFGKRKRSDFSDLEKQVDEVEGMILITNGHMIVADFHDAGNHPYGPNDEENGADNIGSFSFHCLVLLAFIVYPMAGVGIILPTLWPRPVCVQLQSSGRTAYIRVREHCARASALQS